jgi:hypothetical protein
MGPGGQVCDSTMNDILDANDLVGLADDNDLWAHIEAYASVITACLPTLGPLLRGFRPLESILGSVRSLFSVRSHSASTITSSAAERTAGRAPSNTSLDRDKRAWYELNTIGSKPSTVTRGDIYDTESRSQRSDVIMVNKTVSMYDWKTASLMGRRGSSRICYRYEVLGNLASTLRIKTDGMILHEYIRSILFFFLSLVTLSRTIRVISARSQRLLEYFQILIMMSLYLFWISRASVPWVFPYISAPWNCLARLSIDYLDVAV